MELRIKELTKIVEASMRLCASVSKGTLFNNSSALVKFSTEEPNQNQGRDFFKIYGQISIPFVQGKSESFSPSRNLRLLVKEGDKKEEPVFELWDSYRLRSVKELKKVHSTIVGNSVFGEMTWSSDERYVAYVAEGLSKKSSSFWSGEENVGNSNIYKENFGEGMPNLTDPKLYVFDTQDNTVNEINVPDHVYPAQPKFRPNTNSLVFVGFKKTPYKLGINVMLNRGTQLFHLDVVSKEIEEIALPDSCVAGLYPKFNSSGNQFAYFGVPKGKRSHVMCLTLNVTEWETKQSRCLVDVVEDFNEDFNGIYGYHDTLSGFNWLSDDNIIFDTPHKGSRCIFTADLNGRIKEYVHNLQKPYDLALLDIYNGSALIKASNPLNFPKILTAHLVNEEWITTQLDDLTPTPLTPEEQQIMDTLSRTNLTTLKHKNSDMTSFLIHTAPTNPLFIIPHGGPHSSAFTDLTFVLCARLALGYNVLLPNYRGSIGYGSKNVEALLTHVGDMDVEDCIESIEMAKEHVSTHFVIAYGGSHGGFLSAHLATRGVPNLSIVANGVADISSMSLVSDITDWCFAEVFNTDPVYPPTPAQITEMYRMSPLSKSGNIDIPVMIVAGGADKRVPPQASMQLYRVLKANGVDVKLLWYENDGHSLLTKSTAYDFIVNQLLWVEEKMKSENKSI